MNANTNSIQYDVFASHNGKDKTATRAIVQQWRDLGLRVFFDEDSIAPGENVVSALENGLASSAHVVLFISNDALDSPWVAMEVASTVYRDPGNAGGSLIPVYLEAVDASRIRLSVRQLNHVNLYDSDSAERDYHRLLKWLGVDAKNLPPPPSVRPVHQKRQQFPVASRKDSSQLFWKIGLASVATIVLVTLVWFVVVSVKNDKQGDQPKTGSRHGEGEGAVTGNPDEWFLVSDASTDFTNPSPLPSMRLRGLGTRKSTTYYFVFHAGPGRINIEATAHNDSTGSAVNVIVTDLDNSKKFADIHFGYSSTPKTLKTGFVYGRESRMLLRLETDESTVEYRVLLTGAVKLPGEEVERGTTHVPLDPDAEYLVVGASTDFSNPSPLPSKHLHGFGIRESVSYYFKFFAGPGEIEIAATAHNDSTGSALKLNVTDLDRSQQFAKIHFGFSDKPKTLRDSFSFGSRTPILLQLTLDDSSVEYNVRLAGAVFLPQ